jgi:glycosyltransferase involved in cell wall biosynthesis
MLKVSILIPCYNAEQWIGPAIQSALDQTHPHKEVIVVDDGSSDGSIEVAKSFGSRIRFEAGPDRGGNAARNRLLSMAKGQWVQFLDADDYLRPNKIQQQIETCGTDADVIYSPVTIETWSNERVEDTTIHKPNPDQSLEEQWIRWQVAQTGAVLWRKSALHRIGGWNEQYPCCQDNEVTLRAIKNGLEFHFCGHADAVYRIWSDDTVCRKNPTKVIQYKTKLIDEMLDWLKGEGRLNESHSIAAGQAFFEMARTLTQFDAVAAEHYASERIRAGTFLVTGPAAPRNYKFVYRILGFKNTERIAAWMHH